MSHEKKNPRFTVGFLMTWLTTNGGAGQNVFAFWKPLRYLECAIYKIGYSLTQNLSNFANVSPTRCETLALICARTSKKHNQSCCMNRVTPRTTRQPITEDYKVIVSLLTRASLVTRVYIIG